MEYVRVDNGLKRGKRIKPNQIEAQARNQAGQFLTNYSPELKARAIEQGITALECGGRIEELADQLGIPRATMYSWLIGHDIGTARTLFFDGQCALSLAEIRAAATPLDLTRAREWLSGWIKVAERRDPRSYAQQSHVIMELTGDLGDRLRRARERVIEGEATVLQCDKTAIVAIAHDDKSK